jgi:cytoskeletal protein RodZ
MASSTLTAGRPSSNTSGPVLELSRFRKRAGVSLSDIADTTKISSRFLCAIEDEDFKQLPGGIIGSSYVRQYAAAIGYDEDALVEYYRRRMNISIPSPKEAPQQRGNRSFLDRWLRTLAQAPR